MKAIKTIKTVSVSNGVGKTGKPYKRFEFEFSDGFKLSSFDEKIGTAFQAGQNVEVETEQKGAYQELKSMVLYSGAMPEAIKPIVEQNSPTREKSIIAQTLTKCWAETQIDSLSPEQVLTAYKYFLDTQ